MIHEKRKKERAIWIVADSPCLSCNFKDNDVAAVKHWDNDQKHQQQEADEKHNGLDSHSCRVNTETGHFEY